MAVAWVEAASDAARFESVAAAWFPRRFAHSVCPVSLGADHGVLWSVCVFFFSSSLGEDGGPSVEWLCVFHAQQSQRLLMKLGLLGLRSSVPAEVTPEDRVGVCGDGTEGSRVGVCGDGTK